jgi:transposase-like protein
MPKQRSAPGRIIGLLRQAAVELAQGLAVSEVCRGFGVSGATYRRRRAEYGGLKVDRYGG